MRHSRINLLLLALGLGLCAPAHAAQKKNGVVYEIRNDLIFGSGGGPKTSANYRLHGAMGQFADGMRNSASFNIQDGFYTHVSTVAPILVVNAQYTSAAFTFFNAINPTPTSFIIEASTAPDFSGILRSTMVFNPLQNSATVENLIEGGTYYARVLTSYMDEERQSVQITSFTLAHYCGPLSTLSNGLWSNPGIWDAGFVPKACNTSVQIFGAHNVTVDISSAQAGPMTVDGTLTASRVGFSSLTVHGSMVLSVGARVDYGTAGDPITAAATAHLVLAPPLLGITHPTISVPSNAHFTLHGAAKSPRAFLLEDIGAGSNNFKVSASSVTGWNLGDTVMISPTESSGFAALTSARITNISINAGVATVSVTPSIAEARIIDADPTGNYRPVVVANMTRNVLVYSSGTNFNTNTGMINTAAGIGAGTFDIRQARLEGLGGTLDGEGAVVVNGAVPVFIASSAFVNSRGGLRLTGTGGGSVIANNAFMNVSSAAIYVNFTNDNKLYGNVIGGGLVNGIDIRNGLRTVVSDGWVFAVNVIGIHAHGGSVDDGQILDTVVSGAAQSGVLLSTGSSWNLERLNVFKSGVVGLQLQDADEAYIADTLIHDGMAGSRGLVLQAGSTSTYASGLVVYNVPSNGVEIINSASSVIEHALITGNGAIGYRLQNSEGAILADAEISFNGTFGTEFVNSFQPHMVGASIHSNTDDGMRLVNVHDARVDQSALGYDPDGAASLNGDHEISFDPALQPEGLMLRQTRVSTAAIDRTGFTGLNTFIAGWGLNYSSGTMDFMGHTKLDMGEIDLTYNRPLLAATTESFRNMSMVANAAKVCSVDQSNAVTQLITVERQSGSWDVYGSVSGFMGTMAPGAGTCASSVPFPAGTPQFNLDLSESGLAQDGNRFQFVLLGATDDLNKQKKLRFHPHSTGYYSGRSRLEIDQNARFIAEGVPQFPTVIDMALGGTYYHLVSSGVFSVKVASINNVGPQGVELGGAFPVVVLSTVAFDFMAGPTGAVLEPSYLTFNSLNWGATYYGVTFGESRPTASYLNAYNAQSKFSDAGLLAVFKGLKRDLWGEDFDNEFTPGVDKIQFIDLSCESQHTMTSGNWSNPAVWSLGVVPSECGIATISQPHVVEVDVADAEASSVTVYGTLRFKRGVNSALTVYGGTMTVMPGALLDMGLYNDHLTAASTAQLFLANDSTGSVASLWIRTGGNFSVFGATKSPFGYAYNVAPNFVQITAGQRQGWQQGDRIVVAPTGASSGEERTIATISGDFVNFGVALSTTHTPTADTPVLVTNLTRNAVVRSSDTQTGTAGKGYVLALNHHTTGFMSYYGEFAYLGAAGEVPAGTVDVSSGVSLLTSGPAGAAAFISSSSFHDGIQGLSVLSSTMAVYDSVFHGFTSAGISIQRPFGVDSRNNICDGCVVSNSLIGINIETANDSIIRRSHFFGNTQEGLRLNGTATRGTVVSDSYFYANFTGAFGAHKTSFERNRFYRNQNDGLLVEAVVDVNLSQNRFYFNLQDGLRIRGSEGAFSANNLMYMNNRDGMRWENATPHPASIEDSFFLNGVNGLSVQNSTRATIINGRFGYDLAGGDKPNASRQIELHSDGAPESLELYYSRINPLPVVVPTPGVNYQSALNNDASFVISYHQDYDTGTVKVWGNYEISDGTQSLNYANELVVSTTSQFRMMRGTPDNGTFVKVCNLDQDRTVGQLVSLIYNKTSNQWSVVGSSSGFLGTITAGAGTCAGSDIPAGGPYFQLAVAQNSAVVLDGDRMDFAVLGPSRDTNKQKKLLFGYANPSYRQGRARLGIGEFGGLELRGDPAGGNPTLVDILPAGGTYYTLSSSGTFTAVRASFSNIDQDGLQLEDPAELHRIYLATTTFDYISDAGANNAFISFWHDAAAPVFTAQYPDIAFKNSRIPAFGQAVFNARKRRAPSTGLGVTFFGTANENGGAHWGPVKEDDLGMAQIHWQTCGPIVSAQNGAWSSSATWSPGLPPSACNEVTINAAHTVTVDVPSAAASTTTVFGKLSFSRLANSTLTLVGGDLIVEAGGHLDMGTAGSMLTGSSATLTLALKQGLIVKDGGIFTAYGKERSPYSLAQAMPAAGVIEVTAAQMVGWETGDIIGISPGGQGIPGTLSIQRVTGIIGNGLNISPGLSPIPLITSTTPVVVVNLTRNVTVLSSGTVATGANADAAYILNLSQTAANFSVNNAALVGLGNNVTAQRSGLHFSGAGVAGSISSSTILNPYNGLTFDDADAASVRGLSIIAAKNDALRLISSTRGRFDDVVIASGAARGLVLSGASIGNDFNMLYAFANALTGISLSGASTGNKFFRTASFRNTGQGLDITGASDKNVVIDGLFYRNSLNGAKVSGSDFMIFGNAKFFNNQLNGLEVDEFSGDPSDRTALVRSFFAGNGLNGVSLKNGDLAALTGNHMWSNAGNGLRLLNASTITVEGGSIGYDYYTGNPASNTLGGFGIDNTNTGDAEFRSVLFDPFLAISTPGFNQLYNSVISYNHSLATGVVRIYGDHNVAAGILSLETANRLYSATHTPAALMRGNGSVLTVCSMSDAAVLSQGILVEYDGSNWVVSGSSSGSMGTVPSNTACPGTAVGGGMLNLRISAPSPQLGDFFAMALMGRSYDAPGEAKSLLFGPASDGFRGGRSKLTVAPGAELRIVGTEASTVTVNMLAGSTYYTLVDSGAFTVQFASFSNMDPKGLQLSGSGAFSMSSTTFDFLGFAATVNSYMTLRDFVGTVTFDNVAFKMSRPQGPYAAYNVALEGDTSQTRVNFTTPNGALWGETFDLDAPRRVGWETCDPLVSFQSGDWHDSTTWDLETVPRACNDVDVLGPHIVDVKITTAAAKSVELFGGGRLRFSRVSHSSLTLVGGDLTVQSGGILDMGTVASPIAEGTTAHLVLAHGASAGQFGLKLLAGSNFSAVGSTKTPHAVAAADVSAGIPSAILSAAPTGWKPGDLLVFAPTRRGGSSEQVTLTNVSGLNVDFTPALSEIRYATETARILNLSRNVLIRSSGTAVASDSAYLNALHTQATSFIVANAEFAYLGANAAGKQGLVFGTTAPFTISSAAIHHGYDGLRISGETGLPRTLGQTVLYNMAGAGLTATSVGALRLTDTVIGDASGSGMALQGTGALFNGVHVFGALSYGVEMTGVHRSTFSGMSIYSNASDGLELTNSGNIEFHNLTVKHSAAPGIFAVRSSSINWYGGESRGNAGTGVWAQVDSDYLGFDGFDSTDNDGNGMELVDVDGLSLMNSELANNSFVGLVFSGGQRGLFFNNKIASHTSQNGVSISGGAQDLTWIDSYAFNNLRDLRLDGATDISWYRGALGYNQDGVSVPALSSEVDFNAAATNGMLLMWKSRVNPAPGISAAGLTDNKFLIEASPQGEPGVMRMRGDIELGQEPVILDFNQELFAATNTPVNVMRGPTPFAQVCSVNGTYAVSQLVSVVYTGAGGVWRVFGSSSGFMGTVTSGGGCTNLPSGNDQVGISLANAGGQAAGDTLRFGLMARSGDSGMQKRLQFAPAAPTFNGGKSFLGVQAIGGLTLRGTSANPTLVDMVGGGTYYTLVSSGILVIENARLHNLDSKGLQIYKQDVPAPPFSVTLASTTFDFMGIAEPVGTYLTIYDAPTFPLAGATFYTLNFGLARSTHGVIGYGARYVSGVSNSKVVFRRSGGLMSGEANDDDGGFTNNPLQWTPYAPTEENGVFGSFPSSFTASLREPGNDAGTIYVVEISPNADFSAAQSSATVAPFLGVATVSVTGLTPNTTHYGRAYAVDFGTSPILHLGTGSSMANPPYLTSEPFLFMDASSVTVRWGRLPSAPQSDTSEGYSLEASSYSNFAYPVFSSTVYSVTQATLTVSGLDLNTTYYFRVGSLNWASEKNFVIIGATSTLTRAVTPAATRFAVFPSSVTAFWTPLAASPQADTAQGYRLEASLSSDFTGSVVASVTASVAADRLTIEGLSAYTTYYFRVGSLNWNSVSSYTVFGATIPTVFRGSALGVSNRDAWGVSAGDYDRDGDLDLGLGVDGGGDEFVSVNNGAAVFALADLAASGGNSRGVAWGDYDGDGDLDLAVANSGSDDKVYRKGGAGFTAVGVLGLKTDSSEDLVWGDFDNDGDLDLAVAVSNASSYISFNDAGATWPKLAVPGVGNAHAVAAADYDGDGDLDLLFAKDAAAHVLARNDGGAGFTAVTVPAGAGASGRDALWADFNKDGRLDFMIARTGAVESAIWFNQGAGVFSNAVLLTGSGGNNASAAAADFDGDGDLDILLTKSTDEQQRLLVNNGSGVFSSVDLAGTRRVSTRGSAWGDFDGDGDLDAVFTGAADDDTLLRNEGQFVNAEPSAVALLPQNLSLQYDAEGATLTFRWAAGDYDARGDSDTVHYSVAVATSQIVLSGSDKDIVSPDGFAVSPADGSPLLGNAARAGYDIPADQHFMRWMIDKPGSRFVSDTTYYFSVQVVDQGLKRSDWSVALASHVFLNRPPLDRALVEVNFTSAAVRFRSAPGQNRFVLEASLNSNFSTIDFSSAGIAVPVATLTVTGLNPNTTYYFRAGALFNTTTAYALTVPNAQATLANMPAPLGEPTNFPVMSSHSLSVRWSHNSNPAGTRYEVVLTTANPFNGTEPFNQTITTGTTVNPQASFVNLAANTTYYLHVQALNHGSLGSGFTVLYGTATRQAPVSTVFVDKVTTDEIVVSAYAPTPNFRNLGTGLSATAISIDGGAFSNWKGASWKTAPPLSTARRQLAMAAGTDRIFAVGGNAGGASGVNESYNGGVSWNAETAMTTPRHSLAAAFYNGHMYALGGDSGSISNKNEEYSPFGPSWAASANLPSARRLLSAVTMGTTVYIMGGQAGASIANVDAFNPLLDTWSTAPSDLSIARRGAAAAVINGKIYAVGGIDSGGADLASVEVFDPATGANGTWTAGADMPNARAELAAVAMGGKLYVFGGDAGGEKLALTQEFDPAVGVWAERLPAPTARSGLGAVVFQSTIIVAGGFDGVSNLATVETFDPGTTHRFTGLSPNTQYDFRGIARNVYGVTSAQTSIVTVNTLAAVPAAFVGGDYSNVGVSSVVVRWAPNSNPNGTEFRVQASTASDFTGTLLGGGFLDLYSSTITGLTGNTTYYVRVQARNTDLIETDFFILASTITNVNPPLTAAATYFAVNTTSMTVEWDANGNSVGTYYQAFLSTAQAGALSDTAAVSTTVAGAAIPRATIAPLTANTTYFLFVRAFNGGGRPTTFVALGSTVTLPNLPAVSVPAFNFVGISSVSVNWSQNSNVIGTSYTVILSTSATPPAGAALDVAFNNLSPGTDPASAVLAGILGNTTYFVHVAAKSHAGSLTSFIVAGTTVTRPGVAGSAGFFQTNASSVTVSWASGGNGPNTLYQVAVSSGYGPVPPGLVDDVVFSTVPSGALMAELSAGSLTPNTTYTFYVRAIARQDGEPAGYAMSTSTQTKAAVPAVLAPAFPGFGPASLTTQWSANGNPNGTWYESVLSTAAPFSFGDPLLSSAPHQQSGTPSLAYGALAPNTTYFHFVRALNGLGERTAYVLLGSSATEAAIPAPAPNAFPAVSQANLTAAFTAGVNALARTTYTIEVSTASGFDGASDISFDSVPASGYAITPGGLQPNTTYFVQMQAHHHGGGRTAFAFIGSTVTLAFPPLAVGGGFSNLAPTGLSVAWNFNSNPVGTLYEVERSTASNFSGSGDVVLATQPLSGMASFGTLSPNTTYYFQARARNHGEVPTNYTFLGATSTLASVLTSGSFQNIGESSATVSWNAANPIDVTEFRVVFSPDNTSTTPAGDIVLQSTTPAGAQPTATLSGLASNATYYLFVEAINHNGIPTGFVTILDNDITLAQAPGAASPSFVDVTKTSMTVAWTGGLNTAGTLYEAVLSTEPVFFNALDPSNRSTAVISGLTGGITGLTGNTTYTLFVRAVNGNGFATAYSNLGSSATLPNSPAANAVPTPAVHFTSATVQWDHNGNAQNISSYRVILSTEPSAPLGAGSLLDRVLASTSPAGAQPAATLTGLLSDTTYFVHVAALGHSGALTPFVQVGSTVTRAAAPSVPLVFNFVSSDTVTVEWSGAGNGPGSLYQAILSTDAAAPAGGGLDRSALSFSTSALINNLQPNTTFTLHVRTIARNAPPTAFAVLGATITRAAPPLASVPAFSGETAVAFTALWQSGGNSAGTWFDTVVSTGNPQDLGAAFTKSGSTQPFGAPGIDFAGLEVNTTYYLFVRARNHTGGATAFELLGTTSTLANDPLPAAPTTFVQVDFNAVHYGWAANGNPAGTRYLAEMSLNPGFAPVDRSTITVSTVAVFGKYGVGANLTASTLYYFRVRAAAHGGSLSGTFGPEAMITPPGDTVNPTMNLNTAPPVVWRKNNSTAYDLDFADAGGSDLDRFTLEAWTGAGKTGTQILAPTNNLTGLAAPFFSTDWQIIAGNFNALRDETTNYITVKVFDGSGNSLELQDAFRVLKDTTPPRFVNGELNGHTTPQSAPGQAYDLDVNDPGSGLERFEYSVSTTAASALADLVAWTSIPVPYAAASFTANWTVDANFGLLVEGTTNYVSVRAWDTAGTTATLVDAFYIRKDTSGPNVAITQPAAATSFSSNLAVIQGTASDFIGVLETSVSIKDVSGNVYWDGASFASVNPRFFLASGTTGWLLNASAVTFVNNQAYEFVARSLDLAGNYSLVYATKTVTLDNTIPTLGITGPVNESTITVLSAVTGTAADTGSGLAAIEVQVQRRSDNLYWDFFTNAWNAVPVSAIPTAAASWNLTASELLKANLRNGASYYVEARASDSAVPSNQSSFAASRVNFYYEDATPPAAITDLAAVPGVNPGEITLSWSAPGDDGNTGTILFGSYRIDLATYTPVAFSTASPNALVISTALVRPGVVHSTTVVGLTGNTSYYLVVFTQDDEGLWSPLSNAATAQPTVNPFQGIQGHVRKVSSEGITAVLVEAYDTGNTLVASTFTVADGSGTYSLSIAAAGNYRVQASWTVGDITSSVWIDNVPLASVNVDFRLEVNVTLASVQGTLMTLGGGGGASGSFMSVAQASGFATSFVELHQGGRLAVQVAVGPDGRWRIPNLLPGKFAVRAFNGLEFTQLQNFELGEGEVKDVGFVFDPLPEESVFAFPNPARHQTTVRFVTGLFPVEAEVRIFDIAGSLVREIPGSVMASPSAGLYHAPWDLKNDDGDDVASGVYLFIVKVKGANGQTGKVVKKLAVIR